MPRSEGIETIDGLMTNRAVNRLEQMPRSEGIETRLPKTLSDNNTKLEQMPRSEGIETNAAARAILASISVGTNAPIRGD